MRYLGGKVKIAKHVAAVIREHAPPGALVWEPFCGGLGVTAELAKTNPVFASDAHPALISLFDGVASGWHPPRRVPKWVWGCARELPDSDPLKAFCAFGCSFGGCSSGGYVASAVERRSGRVYHMAEQARTALLRDVPRVVDGGGFFGCLSCFDVDPGEFRPAAIYCDPPYRGRTGYPGVPPFDHGRFVLWVDAWACFCPVLVSEYAFPIGRCVFERARRSTVSRDKTPRDRVERIFLVDNRGCGRDRAAEGGGVRLAQNAPAPLARATLPAPPGNLGALAAALETRLAGR